MTARFRTVFVRCCFWLGLGALLVYYRESLFFWIVPWSCAVPWSMIEPMAYVVFSVGMIGFIVGLVIDRSLYSMSVWLVGVFIAAAACWLNHKVGFPDLGNTEHKFFSAVVGAIAYMFLSVLGRSLQEWAARLYKV